MAGTTTGVRKGYWETETAEIAKLKEKVLQQKRLISLQHRQLNAADKKIGDMALELERLRKKDTHPVDSATFRNSQAKNFENLQTGGTVTW